MWAHSYILEHCFVHGNLHYNAETTDSNLISFPATAIIEILQHPPPSPCSSHLPSSLSPQTNRHHHMYHEDNRCTPSFVDAGDRNHHGYSFPFRNLCDDEYQLTIGDYPSPVFFSLYEIPT